ncbi:N-6 DNA methylase [Nocardiopsis sp. YSL2]|uniref:N-6 DNA methylase n=1 Tax=Nocardiopsis sp. YSL2 TaxID=2939492 RepID=UPI0026F44425|nr:N-6 DNA methylase [Nocardiopsis sp. YSL2]
MTRGGGVEEVADLLFQATEKLAGKTGLLRACRAVSALVVLEWSGLDAGGLGRAWEAWRTQEGRDVLFPEADPFHGYGQAGLAETVTRVRAVFGDLPVDPWGLVVIGFAYDRYLGRVGERLGKAGGEHFTPRSVNELMVRLAEPEPGMVVGDPYAGSGGTLTRVVEHLSRLGEAPGDIRMSGVEVDQGALFLARVNLYLHGVDPGRVQENDTLVSWTPTDPDGHYYDRIVTNPPFAISYREKEYAAPSTTYGTASENRADLMAVQQVLASLGPDGRAVVAMSHGPLYRSGKEEGIRRALLEHGRIEAVIGIGPNLFYGSAVPACLVVFSGTQGQIVLPGDRILFINAEHEAVSGRNQNRLEPRHIEKITRVFAKRDEIPGFSRLVPVEEIVERDYNLNIRDYIDDENGRVRPPDLRAALTGGVPRREVESAKDAFAAWGIDVFALFARGGDSVCAFPEEGPECVVRTIRGMCEKSIGGLHEGALRAWGKIEDEVSSGGPRSDRDRLLDIFLEEMVDFRVLDEYELRGVFAGWWDVHIEGVNTSKLERRLDFFLRVEEVARARQRRLVDTYLGWGERYGVSLAELKADSERAEQKLKERFAGLGLPLDL